MCVIWSPVEIKTMAMDKTTKKKDTYCEEGELTGVGETSYQRKSSLRSRKSGFKVCYKGKEGDGVKKEEKVKHVK